MFCDSCLHLPGGPSLNESLSCLAITPAQQHRYKAEDWIFASPIKIGRLPYSYKGVWKEVERAAKIAGIGHLGTHAFRQRFRSWQSPLAHRSQCPEDDAARRRQNHLPHLG